MLDPQDRRLLLDALRPPPGYRLDHAVGTTFSLDLLALLTAPLAFTAFEWEDEHGRPPADPYALLAALRQNASAITLFCQLGQIGIPPAHQRLLAELEESVIQVQAPRHAEGGVFHPKVWVLRYAGDGADEPIRYRLLCLSRNLTFDRSWDLALVLDGEFTERKNAIAVNHPIGDFLAALPEMSRDPITPTRLTKLDQLQQEIRRVRFTAPEELDIAGFWPLGLDRSEPWPFDTRIDRLLVISPFLSGSGLDDLAQAGRGDVLISRAEELERLGPEELAAFDATFVLDRAADTDAGDANRDDTSAAELRGLHAKAYIADQGWRATAWVGSANATGAAFSRNVEFLVELEGPKRALGVAAALAEGSPSQPSFRDLLVEWTPATEPELDPAAEALEATCDRVRAELAERDLTLTVGEQTGGLRTCDLHAPDVPLAADVTVSCWLATQGSGTATVLAPGNDPSASFRAAPPDITPFVGFEVEAVHGDLRQRTRFTVKVRLVGDPPGRREAVIESILRDRAGLIRLLLLLLSAGDESTEAITSWASTGLGTNGAGADHPGAGLDLPLLEPLLLRAARDPAALRPLERMISDLRSTPEGRKLLSAEVLAVWDAVWSAVGDTAGGTHES